MYWFGVKGNGFPPMLKVIVGLEEIFLQLTCHYIHTQLKSLCSCSSIILSINLVNSFSAVGMKFEICPGVGFSNCIQFSSWSPDQGKARFGNRCTSSGAHLYSARSSYLHPELLNGRKIRLEIESTERFI